MFSIYICSMYQMLLYFHSIFRWLVLISLIFAIYRAWRGYRYQKPFTGTDNSIRHWTATISHIQLILGSTLYFKSPFIKGFWADLKHTIQQIDLAFFGIAHFALMALAIILITIGSALSKRKPSDQEKFHTMLIWFSIALLIIFVAIPWPFSPFANRPYLRHF